MAENPKKKTDAAADAPQTSGAAPVPTSAPTPAKAEVAAPTSRERELQDEIDFLREEIAELKSSRVGAESGPSEEKMLVLIDRLGGAIGTGVAKALEAQRQAHLPGKYKPAKRVLPEELKGPRTYFVGPKGAYQNNRRFVQGEKITIVDQFPASDWTPVESATITPPQAPAPKQGRASDQTVG